MSNSIREALSTAIDEADEADEELSFEETPQEVIVDGDTADGDTADGDTADGDTADGDTADGDTADGDTADGDTADGDRIDTRSLKAPVDWAPKEREDWSRIPRHLQEKIVEREKAMATNMEKSAVARKTAEDFNRVANSYGPVLNGVVGNSPMEAVENMFGMAANLRMGTANEKAATIAGLIQQFDVDIKALDAAIVGAEPDDPNANIEKLIKQQLNPIVSQFENQQAQQHNQVRADAEAEVVSFAEEAEFLNDVREDMADLIELASKRGENMTMRQAYGKACVLHPEVSKIIHERAEKKRLSGEADAIANKRRAASPVPGRRGGGGGPPKDLSIRDSIANAWDAQAE